MAKKLQKKKTREIIARERTREKTLKIQLCSSASSVVVLLCIALFVLEAITALAEMGATAKDIILLMPIDVCFIPFFPSIQSCFSYD